MADVVRMPSILAGADEASISKWLVEIGGAVVIGEPLAELETEKAIVEYSAEVSGILGRIIVQEGNAGEIGAPIAVVIADGEGDAEMDAALGNDAAAVVPTVAEATVAEATVAEATVAKIASVPVVVPVPLAAISLPIATAVAVAPTVISYEERTFATPLARKVAKDKALDLSVVHGSGPGGRIVRRDLESLTAAIPTTSVTAVSAAPVVRSGAPSVPVAPTLIPHTGMRKAIARRLTESKSTVPHFYLTADCNVDALFALRTQINAASTVRVSVNDLIVKAIACAFVEVPAANVTWTDEGMLQHSSIDISVAVSTKGGLLTPVLRDVANLTITAVTIQIKELVAKAREKRLRQDELEGGSFAISNLGMFGTQEFSAILNPPQSGILAVGVASQRPVVIDGALAIASVMKVTQSVDHRAVDGALAATWLAAFVRHIESPIGLLL